jgi:lipopolysaccharide exporter
MANAVPATPRLSLTARTARGVAWMMGRTIGCKALQVLGQIVLAWLLAPDEFGRIAIASAVFLFIIRFQDAGLREVLVHRQKTFRHWANPALWMAGTFGLITGGVIAALAPLASRVFHAPVTGLLLILALVAPITAIDVPPFARLQNELRFKTLTMIGVSSTMLTVGLQILLAFLGFGVYAWVIPLPINHVYRAAAMWLLAPTRVRRTPQLRRWRYLMPDGLRLISSNLFRTAIYQGDYVFLGIFFSTSVVGIYYFAYGLSMQTIRLLTLSLAQVLFPALSRLQLEANRQRDAFLRAAKALTAVGVPICLLQAAVAEPLIHLVFQEKWYPAIIIFQVLSVGMLLRLVLEVSESMLKAQGRFGMLLGLSAGCGAAFLGMMYAATTIADEQTAGLIVAVAVAFSFLVFGPLHVYVAIRPAGGRGRDVLGVYAAPVLSGVIAVGVGWALSRLVPAEPGRNLGQIARVAVAALTTVVLYLPLIRSTAPGAWDELKRQVVRFRGRAS